MNKGPTLATLVKKWHRTYSHKAQWDFEYFPTNGNYATPDLNRGLLRHRSRNCLSVLIQDNFAVIGSEIGPTSTYSDFKLIAADPRFFAKLDRLMQFATSWPKRRDIASKVFEESEHILLREVLK